MSYLEILSIKLNQNYTQIYFNTLLLTHVSNQAVIQLTQQQNALTWDSFLDYIHSPALFHEKSVRKVESSTVLSSVQGSCVHSHRFFVLGAKCWAVKVKEVQEAVP